MTIGTCLYIWFNCKKIGEDEFGNCYYIDRNKNHFGYNKRMVIYRGAPEASKVPPVWHAWLHYNGDAAPTPANIKKYFWQIGYLPNLTGTKFAYFPTGDPRGEEKLESTSGNYQAWDKIIS